MLIIIPFLNQSEQSNIPVNEQGLSYEGRDLTNPKATIRELGVQGENAMILLRRKVANVGGRCDNCNTLDATIVHAQRIWIL